MGLPVWKKLNGFINEFFRVGFTGPTVAKDGSDNDQLNIRNNANTSYGKLRALIAKFQSLDIIATDSYKTSLSMATGASGDISLVLPNNDGNNGDILYTDGSGSTTWGAKGGTESNRVSDYDLYYDSASTINLTNMADNTWIDEITIEVITAFDGAGGRTLEIGIAGSIDKHVSTNEINLKNTGIYALDILQFEGSAAQMIATFTAATSGATEGLARIVCTTSVPV